MQTIAITTEEVPMRCEARTHAVIIREDEVRIRCSDRRCGDVRHARNSGLHAFHVWNVRTGELVRTEFEEDRHAG